MAEGLNYSVLYYTGRNGGGKTKQKKCSTLFRTKNTSFNKNHPDGFRGASLKMIKKWIKK